MPQEDPFIHPAQRERRRESLKQTQISRFPARKVPPGIKDLECSSNHEDYFTLIVSMVAFKYKLVLIFCVHFSVMHSEVNNCFYCFFPALSKMVKDAVVLQL